MNDDASKVMIHKDYIKGQCIYNLLDAWNKSDHNFRMAGNMYSLNKMIKEKINGDIIPCNNKRNCFSCSLDHKRNYENYMMK